MTKADLINEITIETGFDKKTVSMIVERMMTEIKGSLIKGENVYLRGFGSLVLKKRKAKVARNISQNTTVLVPEHKIAFFKPAKELADKIR
jgi:DNA-binding protein HU-beta